MKRLISLFIAASFLLAASACGGGGSASLWGQYITPTPLGGASPTSAAASAVPATPTPETISPIVPEVTNTPAPTFSEAFVTQEATAQPENTALPANTPTLLYYAQSGDWLPAVAIRFGVDVNEIASPKILPEQGLLDPGTLLIIPDTLDRSLPLTPALQLIPDNELIYSSTAIDFDIDAYVKEAGGYLSSYRQYLGSTGWLTGSREIARLSYENSINPRLLLAILDYEANWVRGRPENDFRVDY
ncbi:MAG TPA: hypothetical protein VFY83_11160, partial [Anaerolineales bacterium]|nr:hypothetical protein [Anaerolineales bacterium]